MIGVAIAGQAVLAQAPGNYAALVQMYAAGRGAEAVAALLRWPHGEAIGAAKAAGTTLTPREMVPAAILHTEAACELRPRRAERSARRGAAPMRRASLVAACVLAACASPAAQIFRSGVEVVELDVAVVRNGIPVAGLTAADLVLTDNGVPQDVESVTLDRLPLSVTLVFDTSQSVAGERLGHLVEAGVAATAALRPGDRAALVTFSHAVNLRVPLTADVNTLRAALSRLKADGGTALRDALHLALELGPRDRSRPMILLFTDGHDSASWLTEDAVVDTARRAGIVVHAVSVGSDRFLNRAVDASGGRQWSATSDRQLRELFSHALDEMRARYVLS